jgi:hypothetical protein
VHLAQALCLHGLAASILGALREFLRNANFDWPVEIVSAFELGIMGCAQISGMMLAATACDRTGLTNSFQRRTSPIARLVS